MAKRRRLNDLYQIGKLVNFDDDTGSEPVSVWMQKLNPIENEKALRKANAVRSRILASRRTLEGDDFIAAEAEVNELQSRDELLDTVAGDAIAAKSSALEDELAAEDEWSKDDYLQGLNDAWNDGLAVRYADDQEDIEAKQVFEELSRFADIVNDRLTKEHANIRAGFESKSDDDLRTLVLQKKLDYEADFAWLREYRKCEVWLSVRLPENHNAYYFESRDEVDTLAQELYLRLLDEYQAFSVDAIEGKDSPETPPSSPPSPPQEVPEVAKSSGRKAPKA